MTTNGPTPAGMKALTYIGGLVDRRNREEATIRDWVECARREGASWRMIGVACGTTTQAAWDRYSGHKLHPQLDEQLAFDDDEPAPAHQAGFGNHHTVAEYQECPYCSPTVGESAT